MARWPHLGRNTGRDRGTRQTDATEPGKAQEQTRGRGWYSVKKSEKDVTLNTWSGKEKAERDTSIKYPESQRRDGGNTVGQELPGLPEAQMKEKKAKDGQ